MQASQVKQRMRLCTLNTLFALLVLVAGFIFFAPSALAKDYSITQVQIKATVASDGSLDVQEERTYDFDGDYNGVYWLIPIGTYQGHEMRANVLEVGTVSSKGNNAFTLVPSASNGEDEKYEQTETFSNSGSALNVKLYHPSSNEKVTFYVHYQMANAATAWADCGELYWKFVSDGWDVESKNVTCDIYLPAPAGTTFEAEKNVRAWGHGPYDASVEIENDHVHYSLPGVGTSEFAEARITFPTEWLSECTPSTVQYADIILSEEQKWAADANKKRQDARNQINLMFGGAAVGCVGIPLSAIVVALVKKKQYKESHRPLFQDEYFRDVPSGDHPAALGALYNEGQVSPSHLSASILRLADMKVIELEKVDTEEGIIRKKMKAHYRVSLKNATMESFSASSYANAKFSYSTKKELSSIDRATITFLFQKVAPYTGHFIVEDNKVSLWMDDIEAMAKSHPELYDDAYQFWKRKVDDEMDSRRFFVDDTGAQVSVGAPTFLAFLGFVAAIATFAGIMHFHGPVWAMIGFPIVGVLLSLAVGKIISNIEDMSKEAIELKAELVGLRNWFCDFTKLDEAIPHDVILWNQLLVLATALGVADRVIKNLKVVYPELFNESWDMYYWYSGYGYSTAPFAMVTQSVASAHSISTEALASSSDSSGSGGGGGFSSGGGGGFGGGGGGGAF